MSLTTDDLQQIRSIIREEVRPIVQGEIDDSIEKKIRPLIRDEVDSILTVRLQPIKSDLEEIKGKVEALENDVKDIYGMIPG